LRYEQQQPDYSHRDQDYAWDRLIILYGKEHKPPVRLLSKRDGHQGDCQLKFGHCLLFLEILDHYYLLPCRVPVYHEVSPFTLIS
jgi:hypothetical protein